MKKAYILLLGLMVATPSYAYYGEYGYDMDYSADADDYGYDSYGIDDVYEKTSYVKKSTTSSKQSKFSSGEQYIKAGAVMSNLGYKFKAGEDKYSTYGLSAGFGVKLNNEISADVTATMLSVVNTEKNKEKKETDLLVFSNNALFLSGAYNFSMGNDFIPYVTAGVGVIQRKIEGDSVNNDVEVQKKDKDGNWIVTQISEQALTVKSESVGFGYQVGAGLLMPLNNMTLDVNFKYQDFGNIDKIKVDLYNGKSQEEDNAKVTATTIGASIRVAI